MKHLAVIFALLSAAPAFAAEDALGPAANAAYLAASAARPGTIIRPSGLQYRILRRGFGRRVTANDVAKIAYSIRLVNGVVADHTPANLPTALAVSTAGLAGLSEALLLMHEGDRWELVMPANLALGTRGGGGVPPGQVLTFDLTVISSAAPLPGQAPPDNPLSVWGNGYSQGATLTIRR